MATFVTMSAETSPLYGKEMETEWQNKSRASNERTVMIFLFTNRGKECKRFKLVSSPPLQTLLGRFLEEST